MNFTRILQRPLYILGEYPQFPLCNVNFITFMYVWKWEKFCTKFVKIGMKY